MTLEELRVITIVYVSALAPLIIYFYKKDLSLIFRILNARYQAKLYVTMSNKIPDEELNEWLDYVKGSSTIKDDLPQEIIPHEGNLTIDLHHKTLDQSYQIIEKAFQIAQEHKLQTLEIITGIGKNQNQEFGLLHQEIPKFLEHGKFKPLIQKYETPPNNQGSLIVKLKKAPS